MQFRRRRRTRIRRLDDGPLKEEKIVRVAPSELRHVKHQDFRGRKAFYCTRPLSLQQQIVLVLVVVLVLGLW